MKKLHIVGGGAIGSLVAAGAQKNGIGNACYPRNIVAMPTEALWQDGGSTMLQPPFNTPTVLDSSDVLVFPLKVYQLQQAITQWLPYLENTPTIVLLHNGMGGLETARSLLPDDYPILLATTSHIVCVDPDLSTTGQRNSPIRTCTAACALSSKYPYLTLDKIID